MKYFGGCDVGSTYTKTVILDENGAIVAANTIKSKINSAQSAKAGLDQAIVDAGLKEISDLTYLIGTGYGRNKVPQADEIISAELEKYVAGNQSMSEAIANMDKNLKAKIGKAEISQ